MALLTDPDSLSQGLSTAVSDAVFTTGVGADIGIDSAGSNLPALAVGEFFEVRDHSVAGNNGLYVVVTVNTSTSSYECDKITGIAPVTATSEAITTLGATGAANEKSVHLDTDAKIFYLIAQGNLVYADGVTMLAKHSFFKEEWKDDATLPPHPFPMIGIDFDAGKWEYGTDPSGNFSGWKPAEDDATNGIYTRRAIRNAGWNEYDDQGVLQKRFFNMTSLGTFEDETNDQAYYAFGDDPTDTSAATDFIFAGPVNEAVQFYDEIGTLSGDTPAYGSTSTITRATGSFITDGFIVGGQVTVNGSTSNDGSYVLTAVAATTLTVSGTPLTVEAWGSSRIAVDNDNAFTAFLRVRDADTYGKTFAQANLASAGETSIVNKVIKFPLSNATDLDITATDATISTTSPWNQIDIRYFDQAFNREVDSATNRNFGIVIDVGTHSGVDGSFSAAGTVLTTTEGGMTINAYQNGSLRIHEGTDENTSFTIASNTATTITISGGSFTATESNISFTAQRQTAVVADKNEIYEKIQYELRQAADIDDTDQVVTGKTADALLTFVGPDLICGRALPTNPNGGGSGVIIEGFDSNDTNNLFFYDNTGTSRNYPFVAAGTLNFNANLVNDSSPYYWLFFEYSTRTNLTDGAIVLPSGNTGDLESPGGNLPTLVVNDYINVTGFTNEENNGIYIVTAINTANTDYTVRKLDGDTLVAESGVTINVDQDPILSDDAIVVNNNSASPIQGTIGSSQIAFDFDYDNNTQGGRTAATNASVVLIAIGLETGQYVKAGPFTITRSTGLSFSATASLERNYSNPA